MSDNCCFSKILMLIDALQRSATREDCFDNTCSRPFLGVNTPSLCFNTRPITFYGCDNNLITVDYDTVINGTPVSGTSGIFRVENVQDCCCVCTILIPNPDTTDPLIPYVSTNQTVTINLKCICALRCLDDTIISL